MLWSLVAAASAHAAANPSTASGAHTAASASTASTPPAASASTANGTNAAASASTAASDAAPLEGGKPRGVRARGVTITADSRVILGETTRATLTVSAVDEKGAPLDVAPPRLVASAGDVGDVERKGPGVWKAVYTPPPAGPPQVAVIVAAIDDADADEVGFVALPLYGRGSTTVHTKPGTDVTVVAGKDRFGPVKADAKGVASVPLVLGPGVRTATTKALDEAGNDAEKKIDLGVPPFNRVAAIALDEVGVSEGTARVLVVCVDEAGAPAEKAKLHAAASSGSVDEGVEVAPGMRAFTVTLGKAKGAVDVTASLAGARESSAQAEVKVIAAGPARAKITLSREKLGDDDTDREILVTAQLVDVTGQPVPPQAAGLFVDLGRLATVHSDADGTRHITWVIPAGSMRRRASFTVHLPSGAVVGRADVTLGMSGAVLSFDPVDFVVADGTNGVDLVVRVRNPDINNVSVEVVDPKDGVVSLPVVDRGVIRARFTPARVDEGKTVHVKARAGDAVADVAVPLAAGPWPGLLLGGSIVAGSNYGKLFAVGPELSIVTHVAGALYAGASLTLLQAVASPVADHRAVPLFAEVQWRPAMSPDASFIVGLDAGPVLSDLVVTGKHTLEFALAAQAVVGAGFRAGPGTVDVVGRAGSAVYLGSATAQNALGLPLGAGLSVGYRLQL